MRTSLLLLLALGPLAPLASSQDAAEKDPLPQVIVTRTWGELAAVEPIELADGVTVRLGVESATSARPDGVLLYGLCSGLDSASSPEESLLPLGPLELTEVSAGESLLEQAMRAEDLAMEVGEHDLLLFVQSITLARGQKERRFHIAPKDGQPVAEVVVRGGKEAPVWIPWMTPEHLTESHSDGHFACAAWPAVPERVPLVILSEEELTQKLEQPLPRMVPQAPTAGCTLALGVDSDLVFAAEQRMITNRAGQHVLARWWIDGRPLRAGQIMNAMQASGRDRFGTEMRLPVAGIAEALGVRAEQGLEVQLLYCPSGWDVISADGSYVRLARRLLEEGENLPVLSPRVRVNP